MARPFACVADGVIVRLKVTPKARRSGFGGTIADADGTLRLKVAVSEAPSDGAANDAVVTLLAKEWRLPRSSFSIVAGAGGRSKTIRIAGDPAVLGRTLESWWTAQSFAAT